VRSLDRGVRALVRLVRVARASSQDSRKGVVRRSHEHSLLRGPLRSFVWSELPHVVRPPRGHAALQVRVACCATS